MTATWRDRYPNAVQRPYDGGALVGTITHGGPNQHNCWRCRGTGRAPDGHKCAGCNGWGWYADGPRVITPADPVTASRTDKQPHPDVTGTSAPTDPGV